MEEGINLPFSSLVASMLLYRDYVTSIDIVNIISLLECKNIFIDEIDNDMDSLLLCVDCHGVEYFQIKDTMFYETYLFERVTVRDFLVSRSNPYILEVIEQNQYFQNETSFIGKRDKKNSRMLRKVKVVNNKCG